jgi:hypothetical protein
VSSIPDWSGAAWAWSGFTDWGMVQQQAAMLSYNDTFRWLAGMFLLMLPLLLLMRKAKKGKAVMAH